jgi:hypothetical protein
MFNLKLKNLNREKKPIMINNTVYLCRGLIAHFLIVLYRHITHMNSSSAKDARTLFALRFFLEFKWEWQKIKSPPYRTSPG